MKSFLNCYVAIQFDYCKALPSSGMRTD